MLLGGKFALLILFWVKGRYASNPYEVYGFLVLFWVFGVSTSDQWCKLVQVESEDRILERI